MSGTKAAQYLVLERWYGGRIGVDTEETRPFEAKIGGSLSRFIEEEALEKSVPMVIREFGRSFPDGCPDWAEIRAMCSRNYEATVAVSRGVEEHDGPTTKVRVPVPLVDFVDGILAGNPEAAVVQAQSSSGDDEMASYASGCSSEPYVDGSSQAPRSDGVLYAKQFDIVSLLPELKARLPSWSEPLALAPATTGPEGGRDYEVRCKGLFSPWRCLHTVCGWIAPAGAVTGAHTDDEHNVLVVLAGEKAVTLVPPADAGLCYPNSKYDSGTVCFDADIECPDLEAHPQVGRARRQTVLLRAGDALVLPQGWVHQVRSPVASASLNVFASTVGEAVTHGAGRMLAEWMHGIGVYRWGHCVCHSAADCGECGGEDGECGGEVKDRDNGRVKDRVGVARGSLLALAGAAVGVGLAGAFASRMAAVGSGCLGLR